MEFDRSINFSPNDFLPFLGLAINEECLNFIPSRHYAAYM
jgi:hypothetical protein